MVFPDSVIQRIIRKAIEEDVGAGDITTEAILPSGKTATAEVVAKEDLVLAGARTVRATFHHVDPSLDVTVHCHDGDRVVRGKVMATVRGSVASILKAERVCLNLLQHLCGVATVTAAFVARVSGLPVRILDTRKTLPGFRVLDKYAVRVGGGYNHRFGLYDGILIKDNHIAVAGGIIPAVRRVRERFSEPGPIVVEVTNLDEVREAVVVQADVIMLDNMNLGDMRAAVEWIGKRAETEASGNVTLRNVREVAETGVDRISVGALTHSVQASDISLVIRI